LETAANLLRLLEHVLAVFSKCALKSLNNQTDFDSAIRRFDPSRPSHRYPVRSGRHLHPTSQWRLGSRVEILSSERRIIRAGRARALLYRDSLAAIVDRAKAFVNKME
jgi:hypothetical protein